MRQKDLNGEYIVKEGVPLFMYQSREFGKPQFFRKPTSSDKQKIANKLKHLIQRQIKNEAYYQLSKV